MHSVTYAIVSIVIYALKQKCCNKVQGAALMSDQILAVNVTEAARRLGISVRTVATLIAKHRLPSCKIGRRRVIPVHSLEKFLKGDQTLERTATVAKLFCRVCGKGFRTDGSLDGFARVISHLENSHPESVLPTMQEFLHLDAQLRK